MSDNKTNNFSNLKNIIFIHDKYNSYENINLYNPSPKTQRDKPYGKEKFNMSMNHMFYNTNNSVDEDISSSYPKKIFSPRFVENKQSSLKKIFISNIPKTIPNHNYSNITQTKKKSDNSIKITNIKREYPKNYNYYERKETSNNKKVSKEVLRNKKLNKHLLFNSNTSPGNNRISSPCRYQKTDSNNNNKNNPVTPDNYLNYKQNINANSHNYDNNTKKLVPSENYHKNIRAKPQSSKNVTISYSNNTLNKNNIRNNKAKHRFTSIPQKEIAFTYCKTDNNSLGKKNYSTKNIYRKQTKEKTSLKVNYLSPKLILKTNDDNNLSVDKNNSKSKTTKKVSQLSNKCLNNKLNVKTDVKNTSFDAFERKKNISTTHNETDSHSKINTTTETNENIISNTKLNKKIKNKNQKKLLKVNKLNSNNSHIKIYNKNDIHLTSITNINNKIISNDTNKSNKSNSSNNSNNKRNTDTEKSPSKSLIKIHLNNKKPKQKSTHRLTISGHKSVNNKKYNTVPGNEISKNNKNNINNSNNSNNSINSVTSNNSNNSNNSNINDYSLNDNLFDQEWNSEKFMGKRKRTYDQKRKNNKQLPSQVKNCNSNISDNNINMYFIPNIYVKDIKAASQAGREESHYTKTNQDSYLIEKNINGILNYNLFGVFDGHGPYGHFASQFVSKYIAAKLKNHPKLKFLEQPSDIYHKIKEKNFILIEEIFLNADSQIQSEKFNSYLSGTTVVIVIQLEEHLVCANCGDSRAIIIIDEDYNNNLINSKSIPLSIDCKPELLEEKKRIIKKGGVVEKSENELGEGIGPFRVWDGDNDYPGLAMSRSIGDIAAKKVGVIPNPIIMEYTIDYFSKYLVICSDGVWEFLSNKEVMEISNKYYLRNDASGLCQKLIKKATQRWEEEDCVIDDITVVAVFF